MLCYYYYHPSTILLFWNIFLIYCILYFLNHCCRFCHLSQCYFFALQNACSDNEREKYFQGRWKSGQSLLRFIKLLMRQHTWHGLDKPPGKLFQDCLGQALNSPLTADGFPMRSPPQRTSELPVISHPEMFVLGVTFWKMHVLPYKTLKKDLKIRLIKSLWFCLGLSSLIYWHG